MTYKTILEVEQYAASEGIVLTPADRAKIAASQTAEAARLEALTPKQIETFADRFNDFYPRLLQSVIALGETVLTFSQTVITSLGVPIVLVLLLIVEHHRVVDGILLFDNNPVFAGFAAAALVMLNLVLEFQTHHIEHQAGYKEDRALLWSARIWAKNMAYRLGTGKSWVAVELSPAARYKSLLRLVTFTILALALVGSMRGVIEQIEGAWYQALVSIAIESDLLLMMTWLGGLLFAAAAVLSAQGLSRYVAIRCVEILAAMQADQKKLANPHSVDIEQAGANVALALVNDKLKKKVVDVKPVPFGSTATATSESIHQTPNGNGRTANGNGSVTTKDI